MKSTLLRTFFEWALITSVLMSVGFFAWFYFKSHAVRSYSAQVANEEQTMQARLQHNGRAMALLLAECQQYARTNADMARLLEPQKPALTAPTSPAPAARPAKR